jgi:glutamine amidotransferase
MKPTLDVALFDYGAGNLHSLGKALEAGGARVVVTRDWGEALKMDALVLPGVGSFGAAVRALRGQEDRVRGTLQEGLPCLGICLGMQLFFQESEEGPGAGIGIIPGRVRKLRTRLVPQMGWNDVTPTPGRGMGVNADVDPLFAGLETLTAYYANSYVCEPDDPNATIATTLYQEDTFPAGVRRWKTWGVQFHPEKSSAPGLKLIGNFLEEVRS